MEYLKACARVARASYSSISDMLGLPVYLFYDIYDALIEVCEEDKQRTS